jgi:hypothetical protein
MIIDTYGQVLLRSRKLKVRNALVWRYVCLITENKTKYWV